MMRGEHGQRQCLGHELNALAVSLVRDSVVPWRRAACGQDMSSDVFGGGAGAGDVGE